MTNQSVTLVRPHSPGAPAHLGDVLTATCREVSKSGRTGVYDTEVVNQYGKRIALFRGRSHTMRGHPAVAP